MVCRRKAMLEATEPLMSENGIPRREATMCWPSGTAMPRRQNESEDGRTNKKRDAAVRIKYFVPSALIARTLPVVPYRFDLRTGTIVCSVRFLVAKR